MAQAASQVNIAVRFEAGGFINLLSLRRGIFLEIHSDFPDSRAAAFIAKVYCIHGVNLSNSKAHFYQGHRINQRVRAISTVRVTSGDVSH